VDANLTGKMGVKVDQSRKESSSAEIVNYRAGRDCHLAIYGLNAIPPDQDHRWAPHRATISVDELGGPDNRILGAQNRDGSQEQRKAYRAQHH